MLKIFVFVAFSTLLACTQSTEAATPCGKITTKYFSSAEQKLYPPRPERPQSEDWANSREQIGGAYYIAEYCESGEIISLTKRLNKEVNFKYDYIYEDGKLTAVDLTDQQGKKRYQP